MQIDKREEQSANARSTIEEVESQIRMCQAKQSLQRCLMEKGMSLDERAQHVENVSGRSGDSKLTVDSSTAH
jgi:hypothetical protein